MGRKPDHRERIPLFFFKVLMDDFSLQLKIPLALTKHFGGDFPRKCIIWSPTSKQSWQVDLQKRENYMVFTSGWEIFVRENSLKTTDFLVFHYDGKSKFEVRIFEKTGCEKEIDVPFLTDKEKPGQEVQIIEDEHNAKQTEHGAPILKDEHKEKTVTHPRSTQEETSYEKSIIEEARKRGGPSKNTRRFQENGTLKGARKVRSEEIIVEETRKKGRPSKSTRGFQENGAVKGASKERSEVLIIEETRKRGRPSKVRTEFEQDGAFKEASKCAGKFKQAIIEQEGPSEVPTETSEAVRTFTDKSEHIIIEAKLSSRKMRRPSKRSKVEDKVLVRRKGRPSNVLTNSQENQALKMARRFNSDNPFFKIVMHQSYVQGACLSIPVPFLMKYMTKSDTQAIMLRTSNKSWPAILNLYQECSAKICRGWRAFVKENNLQIGNVCVFELVQTVPVIIQLHIFRDAPCVCDFNKKSKPTSGNKNIDN